MCWNGVACNKLLFLLGTVYTEKHGITNPEDILMTFAVDDANSAAGKATLGNNNSFIVHLKKDRLSETRHSEEDRGDEEESVHMFCLNNNSIKNASYDRNNNTNSSRFL